MTVQQMIVVNATQSASYTCVVSNHVVKRGYVVKNATGYVTVLGLRIIDIIFLIFTIGLYL